MYRKYITILVYCISFSPCSGLFTSVLSTMTSTTAAFDLEMHSWLLKLSSNLIAGSVYIN